MAQLSIKNFSCIEEASIEVRRLTVLIGPQASGKSVISKLLYFFVERITDVIDMSFPPHFKEVSLEEHQTVVISDFQKRFPPQTWGTAAFRLEFSHGPFAMAIYRGRTRKNSFSKPRVKFSPSFEEFYDAVKDKYRAAQDQADEKKSGDTFTNRFDFHYKVYSAVRNELRESLGAEFIAAQLFIPAGRSFFTSMGKAALAFEHAAFLIHLR